MLLDRSTFTTAIGVAALASTVLYPQSPLYLGFFLSTQQRSESMRAPGNNLSGWIARYLMITLNDSTSTHVVTSILDVHADQTVMEVGPGSGRALKEILSFHPKRVLAVEISPVFRHEISLRFKKEIKSNTLTVVKDDVKDYLVNNRVPDASIDRILASNVLYFLDPLEDYLEEFYRVLKPGGKLVFAVKDVAKSKMSDVSIFVNTDWDEALLAMKKTGFEVELMPLQLENGIAKYWPLVGVRSR